MGMFIDRKDVIPSDEVDPCAFLEPFVDGEINLHVIHVSGGVGDDGGSVPRGREPCGCCRSVFHSDNHLQISWDLNSFSSHRTGIVEGYSKWRRRR